jgi:hypothetical protein
MKRRDIGRNDPCYCGSGKKFKKCCLGNPNYKDLDEDYRLGQQLVKEYDDELKSKNPAYYQPKPKPIYKRPFKNNLSLTTAIGALICNPYAVDFLIHKKDPNN